jgi:hypothetical protein
MKIGIVTLPFNANYGGILQNYALQITLKKMGHEVLTVSRFSKTMSLSMRILTAGKRILKRIAGKNVIVRTWPDKNELQIIWQNTNRFIAGNISLTETIESENDFKKLGKYGFEAWIVGSDQVWRPKYAPNLENHFLGFTAGDSKVRRIAYAASFGVDNWEFTQKETKRCSTLAKEFDAISVREKSGISLCKNYLKIDVCQVIDPTLLVSASEYKQLVEKAGAPDFKGKLVTYVLDKSPAKKELLNRIADELGLETVSVMPKRFFREVGKKGISECVAPPVTDWIKSFMDAEFVVTDSFHGTAFSIIFNKPFVVVGNPKRGMARFHSLLETFGLDDRLVTENNNNISELIKKTVDFEKVNSILAQKQNEAIEFLKKALQD